MVSWFVQETYGVGNAVWLALVFAALALAYVSICTHQRKEGYLNPRGTYYIPYGRSVQMMPKPTPPRRPSTKVL